MSLAEIVQSSGWKNFMSKLYGIGASIVIVGALFKIQHYPMAGLFLFIGLCTEAIIFFFSAFEPLHEEVDWSLVYPELAGVPDDEEEMALQASRSHAVSGGGGGSAALAKFDEMLASAEITPDVFDSLGKGLKKLNTTTGNLNAMGDVTAATNEFAEKVKGAAETVGKHTRVYDEKSEALGASLGRLDDSYQNTAKIISDTGSNYQHMTDSLSKIEVGGKSYQEKLEALNKNLSALNAVYELQLKGANEQVKDAETLMKGVQSMLTDLKDSAEDAAKYRQHIGLLNQNLAALNEVYGNMLSAMNVK
ncbi:MAG: gliding motility protein GldL [Marinilabiliaceae bacterium]|jgi:gliding motility-associated protein GldL|nr:gliding motility protein GldL [Marinilabiliaceae bacterium]